MGWFDEQIRQRIQNDNDILSDAYAKMANAVNGKHKIEVLFQSDREVAAIAVGEILKYYRVRARKIPESLDEFDEVLEFLLRPAGIMRRNVRLTEGWYKDAGGAMLGSKKDGTVVALIPGKFQGYNMIDPASGSTVRVGSRTAADLDEDAVCFYKPFPLRSINVKDVIVYVISMLRPRDYAWMIGLTGVITLVQALTPRLTQKIYSDQFLGLGNYVLVISLVLVMAMVDISGKLFNVAKTLISQNIQEQLKLQVESATMMRVLSLPMSFFSRFNTGEILTRIQAVSAICSTISSTFFTVFLTAAFSLVYLVQIRNFAPSLLIPALALTLLTAGISLLSSLLQMGISQRQMEANGKENGMVLALLGGADKIKVAGAEKRAFAKWADKYAAVAKLTYDLPFLLKMSGPLTQIVSLLGTVVLYYMSLEGAISSADYLAFSSSYGLIMGAFSGLVGAAVAFAGVRPSMVLAKPIFETAPEIQEQKMVIQHLDGNIEVNHLSFQYTERTPLVLDDLSFRIRRGEYVAIVGKTGCGKSTLVRLLLGFEKPITGGIYYDGRDIQTVDLKSLRRNIGVVMQSGKLFQGDIYSNISISAPNLSMEEAWKVADMSGMRQDIERMPMGMHTLISEGAGGISGGQKQRLMIARAIAPKPKILIFDEATSALDNITQKIVSDSLDSLKCTRIVIAHRLSTIRNCNRILVLDGGHIIEDGTYEELIEKKGFFADLVERQRADI